MLACLLAGYLCSGVASYLASWGKRKRKEKQQWRGRRRKEKLLRQLFPPVFFLVSPTIHIHDELEVCLSLPVCLSVCLSRKVKEIVSASLDNHIHIFLSHLSGGRQRKKKRNKKVQNAEERKRTWTTARKLFPFLSFLSSILRPLLRHYNWWRYDSGEYMVWHTDGQTDKPLTINNQHPPS